MKVRWLVYENKYGIRTDRVLQYKVDGKWKDVPVITKSKEFKDRDLSASWL